MTRLNRVPNHRRVPPAKKEEVQEVAIQFMEMHQCWNQDPLLIKLHVSGKFCGHFDGKFANCKWQRATCFRNIFIKGFGCVSFLPYVRVYSFCPSFGLSL
ncbi:uncharacterized protein LOC144818244 isoform X3 [Lissotriton helveticus]